MDPFIVRALAPDEVEQAVQLIRQGFYEFIAPDYAEEGKRQFENVVHPEAICGRLADGAVLLGAYAGKRLAGIIGIRADKSHIWLLFTDAAFQRQGVARRLLDAALALCRQAVPDLNRLTVNASPYAVPIYEKLGFGPSGPEETKDGIRFTPMVMDW